MNSGANTGPTPRNFSDRLRWHAATLPDRVAYRFLVDGRDEEDVITFAGLDRAARAAAVALSTRCRPGDRVLILLKPGLDYVVGFLGCLYAGLVAVPAYPPGATNKLDRLDGILGDCRPMAAITGRDEIAAIGARLADIAPGTLVLDLSTLDRDGGDAWRAAPGTLDDIAFLQYTSGSTGSPKGVIVTHGNLVHNSHAISQVFGTGQDSHIVSWLPPYHDMGLVGGILQSLYIGFPATLMAPIHFLQRPLRWLQAVSRHRATISGGPNFAYELCVRKIGEEDMDSLDLSHWRIAFNGAEYVRAPTVEAFTRKFARCGLRPDALSPCYGLAEGTLLVTGCFPGERAVVRDFHALRLEDNRAEPVIATGTDAQAPGAAPLPDARVRTLVSSGRAAPGSEPFIGDATGDRRLPEGEVGEICITGGSVAHGYWQRPDATAQAFRGDIAGAGAGPARDGHVFRTGDLGFLLDGELYVTGRIKDLIIVNGVNHHPGDIESTVLRVDERFRPDGSAAFAIDLHGAERVAVVQEVERRALRRLDTGQVCAAIRAALWQHHRLAQPLLVLVSGGTLPRTSSGKVRRQQCRGLFAPMLQRLADGLPLTEEEDAGIGRRLVAVEIDGRAVAIAAAATEVLDT